VDTRKFVDTGLVAVVVACGAGRDFSIIVDSNGVLYSCGHPEFGCLGNGSESKTLEKAGQYTYEYVATPTPILKMAKAYGDVKIVDVACGNKHTCAMDKQGRIYTWGDGAYGRLGHKDNKNQMEPLAVELFSQEPPPLRDDIPKFRQHQQAKVRGTQISCGNTATFVVAGEPFNSLYMFGICKRSGEASMYPTMVPQVQGWRVRSVASGNTSTAVASERSLISWGPSPTFGELGYGENEPRSSTVSKEAPMLKGCLTLQVACGICHTLAIVDTDDEVSRAKLASLPVFAPSEVDPTIVKAAQAKVSAQRKAKRDAKMAKTGKAGAADEDEGDEGDEGEDAAGGDNGQAEAQDEPADSEEEQEEEDDGKKKKRKPAPKAKAAPKAKKAK
jgi:alpha-tubulin suppressor-like RCC1 family protein